MPQDQYGSGEKRNISTDSWDKKKKKKNDLK